MNNSSKKSKPFFYKSFTDFVANMAILVLVISSIPAPFIFTSNSIAEIDGIRIYQSDYNAWKGSQNVCYINPSNGLGIDRYVLHRALVIYALKHGMTVSNEEMVEFLSNNRHNLHKNITDQNLAKALRIDTLGTSHKIQYYTRFWKDEILALKAAKECGIQLDYHPSLLNDNLGKVSVITITGKDLNPSHPLYNIISSIDISEDDMNTYQQTQDYQAICRDNYMHVKKAVVAADTYVSAKEAEDFYNQGISGITFEPSTRTVWVLDFSSIEDPEEAKLTMNNIRQAVQAEGSLPDRYYVYVQKTLSKIRQATESKISKIAFDELSLNKRCYVTENQQQIIYLHQVNPVRRIPYLECKANIINHLKQKKADMFYGRIEKSNLKSLYKRTNQPGTQEIYIKTNGDYETYTAEERMLLDNFGSVKGKDVYHIQYTPGNVNIYRLVKNDLTTGNTLYSSEKEIERILKNQKALPLITEEQIKKSFEFAPSIDIDTIDLQESIQNSQNNKAAILKIICKNYPLDTHKQYGIVYLKGNLCLYQLQDLDQDLDLFKAMSNEEIYALAKNNINIARLHRKLRVNLNRQAASTTVGVFNTYE